MRFLIAEVEHQSETETDYDTAVDLVHSNVSETRFVLRHDSGLQATVQITEIMTSRSSLEPDIPDDYVPGDHVAYVNTPNEGDEPEVDRSSHALVPSVQALPAMDDVDWEVLDTYRGWLAAQTSYSPAQFEGFKDAAQRLKLDDYLEYEAAFDPRINEALGSPAFVSLSYDTAEKLLEYREGQQVDLALDSREVAAIERHFSAAQAQREANAQTRLANNLSRHVWEAKQAIGQQVEQIKTRMKGPGL